MKRIRYVILLLWMIPLLCIACHTAGSSSLPADSTFAIHYLDVTEGDAALVLCDDAAMLINGGGREDSAYMYSYLRDNGIETLEYLLATTVSDIQLGGLSAAPNRVSIGTVYAPVQHHASEAFENLTKQLSTQGKACTVPIPGDTFALGHATVHILGASPTLTVRITYGQTSFLFCGAGDTATETALLSSKSPLKSTLLSLLDYGLETASNPVFLQTVDPLFVVLSPGEMVSNHPHPDTRQWLQTNHVDLFSTKQYGTVICSSDGQNVILRVEHMGEEEAPATTAITSDTVVTDTVDTSSAIMDYIGNSNTKKFHYAFCTSAERIKEANQYRYTGTRENMIAMGYEPCSICTP